jgi:sugar phosphate isomerase/epimerase
MYSRRQFGRVAFAFLPLPLLAAKIDSNVHGVQLGVHTFSFSTLPHDGILDAIVGGMVDARIGECILRAQDIEPGDLWDQVRTAPAEAREKLGRWRMAVSLDYFQAIRRKFENAGVAIYGFGASPNAVDEELHRTFEIAQALGAKIVTLGGTLALAKRLAPIAEKHDMMVGLQGHPSAASTDREQIQRPEDFAEALSLSKNLRLSLDIGDATGAGYDALQFVRGNHDRIHTVYLKDRKKDRTSVPWGEGDTPIKPILQMIRDRKYPIRAYIDCDYKSSGSRAAEVKRCFEYAKAALV